MYITNIVERISDEFSVSSWLRQVKHTPVHSTCMETVCFALRTDLNYPYDSMRN